MRPGQSIICVTSNITSIVFQVEEIEIVMPNQHYFTIDMTKMGLVNKDEVSSVITHNFSS